MSSIQETNLKAIADAIRAKNGTTDPIQASTFPDLIAAISTGMRPRLIVQTVAGATVTATKGEHSYSGTANDKGLCHFELPASDSQGEWTVVSSLSGVSTSSTINIGTQTLIMDAITDPVFSNNDWPTIIAACQSGNVPSTWAVGDSKTMAINNTEYQIDIIGKNHDTYAVGGGTAPLTFQLHDCYATPASVSTSSTSKCIWTTNDIRTSILPSILSSMNTDIQNGIKAVTKLTSDRTAVIETADKLFLLSEIETCGTASMSYAGEGSQYEYYANGFDKFKHVVGESNICDKYWLRSPYKSITSKACVINKTGGINFASADSYIPIAFAFCF